MKQKKRISFGKDEIRYMEAAPGVKSRLGYGRGSSPPPPELDQIDNQSLQTELKRIAVGKGKFELKEVIKVVREMNKSALRDSVTPERSAAAGVGEEKEFYVTRQNNSKFEEQGNKKLQVSIKNDEYVETYNVDKVDLALRAAKLKSNLDQRRDEQSSSSSTKKRLFKVEHYEDGSKRRIPIEPDDPILDTVPVKKSRTEDHNSSEKIHLSEGRTASNFTIVRKTSSSSSLYSDNGGHKTLAQKAEIARNKQDVSGDKKSATPATTKVSYGRAGSAGSNVIKAEDLKKMSVKDRIGSSSSKDESRSPRSSDRSHHARSSKSRDRSPITWNDKSSDRSSGSRSSSSVKDRLGGGGDSHRSSEKNIYSRLGNRD